MQMSRCAQYLITCARYRGRGIVYLKVSVKRCPTKGVSLSTNT